MSTVSWGARRAALVVSSCLAVVVSACSSPGQGVLPKMPTLKAFSRAAVGGNNNPLAGAAQFDAPVVDPNTWAGSPMGTGGFSVAASPTLTGGPASIAAEDFSTSGAPQYYVIIGDFFASSGHGLALVSASPFATGTTALGPATQAVVFDWATGDILAQAQNGSVLLSAAGSTPGQRVTGSLTASFVLVSTAPPPACQAGACVATPPPACAVDTDCPRGEVCRSGACVPSTPLSCMGRQGWGTLSGNSGGVLTCSATGTGAMSLPNAGAYIDSDSGQLMLVVADVSGAQRGVVIALAACPTAAASLALQPGSAQLYDELQVGQDTMLYTVKVASGGSLTFSQVGATVGGQFSVDFQGGATVTGTFTVQ